MNERDGIVVGGGVIGLSVAWRAAQRGLSMSVVDPLPARGASWAAAGMLAPVTEVHPGEDALLSLNRRAGQTYPSFVEELEELTGLAPGYRACGTLVVACDSDERAALEDLFDLQCSLGLATERLPGAECRRLEPALTPRVRAGIWVAGDHQVDNRALVEALLEACRRTGVEILPERAVALRWQGDRVVGIDLGGGESLEGASVVLCAGCWTPEIAGLPEGLVALRPVKGQLLQLRNPPGVPLLGRSVRGGGADHVYIVPR